MAKITWTQRQDIGPSARSGSSLAFDLARARTVLFGGRGADGPTGDTWEWDGGHWTQVQDSGPAPRYAAAMAHGGSGVTLFGGIRAAVAGASARLGDTWSWDGVDWTQVTDSGPVARSRAVMVFDPPRSRYVLFGGAGGNTVFGDTWTFDGAEWTQVGDTGPSPRIGHTMAYDSATERVVLFGGQNIGLANGETWTWDGSGWTRAQDIGPSGRSGHAMAGTATAVWLFGGGPDLDDPALGTFGDSWEWDGTKWTERQDIGPHPRQDAGVAVDSVRDRIVLFGGATVGSAGAAVELLGDTWEAKTDDNGPSPVVTGGVIVVDTSETMVVGSDLGYVTVTAHAPSATDRPLSVSIGGTPESVTSPPLRAGETSTKAFFRMASHSAGTVIQVTVGTSVGQGTLKAAVTTPVRDFQITPSTIVRATSAGFQVRITVPWTGGDSLRVTVMSTAGQVLGTEFVGTPAGQVIAFYPSSTVGALAAGIHQLVAVARFDGRTSVAGPVDFTVT